jgi:hypothetical protein
MSSSVGQFCSDFAWLVYENGLMTYKFCKTFPGMARKSDFLKGCKTFKKETLKIHSKSQKHKGNVKRIRPQSRILILVAKLKF